MASKKNRRVAFLGMALRSTNSCTEAKVWDMVRSVGVCVCVCVCAKESPDNKLTNAVKHVLAGFQVKKLWFFVLHQVWSQTLIFFNFGCLSSPKQFGQEVVNFAFYIGLVGLSASQISSKSGEVESKPWSLDVEWPAHELCNSSNNSKRVIQLYKLTTRCTTSCVTSCKILS